MKLGAAPWGSVPPSTSCDASIRRQATSPLRTSRFRHQRYEDAPRTSPSPLKAESPPCVDDDAWRSTLNAAAARIRAAGVGAVYLVHGTFVGDDPTGIACALGRLSTTAADGLRGATKRFIDWLLGDRGNFVRAYASDLEQALNPPGSSPRIAVRIFNWSGANHHLARADAAVRLLDELTQAELPPSTRILCVGHSHGGNVFALLSHLIRCTPEEAAQFFEAARWHYCSPITGCHDIEAWKRVADWCSSSERSALPPLDIVTFGTPIRYGWSLRDGDRLLHFVHHRSSRMPPDHQAEPPGSLTDLLNGAGGDYTHQIGIAGSNVPPFPLMWRAFWADRRLGRLLQPSHYSLFDLLHRIHHGLRVADAGETLLYDYGGPPDRSLRSLTGHLHYTQRKWLPFHADEIARRLYT